MDVLLFLTLAACRPTHVEPPEPDDLLLVADSGHGRVAMADRVTGKTTGDVCIADVLPEACQNGEAAAESRCLVFEVTHDLDDSGQDLLTMSYGRRGVGLDRIPGGVVQLIPGTTPEILWQVDVLSYPDDPELSAECLAAPDDNPKCRLSMPHAQRWTPDGTLLVAADTLNNRVLFLQPGDGDTTPVVAMITHEHAENPNAWWPNALDFLEGDDGQTLLLVTYKGSDPTVTNHPDAGRLILWDVSDINDVHLVWAWPEDGYLAASHAGSVQDGPDGPLILYAHAFGDSSDMDNGDYGSVGVATFNGMEPPTYLADFLLDPADGSPLGFVRDVDVVDGGTGLLVTDSGCENQDAPCSLDGRVMTLSLDLPTASGHTGAFSPDHAEQVFVEAPAVGTIYEGLLSYPFESDVVPGDERGQTLLEHQPVCN